MEERHPHCLMGDCNPDETGLCRCHCMRCDVAYFQRNLWNALRMPAPPRTDPPEGLRTPEWCDWHGWFEGQRPEGIYQATCPSCNGSSAEALRTLYESIPKKKYDPKKYNPLAIDEDFCIPIIKITQ